MGKHKGHKGKGKKEQNVFKVAGVRKSKTKVINTNLKKLKAHTKEKTDKANQRFTDLQKCVIEATTDTSKTIKDKQLSVKKHKDQMNQKPDVNMAAEEFAKL